MNLLNDFTALNNTEEEAKLKKLAKTEYKASKNRNLDPAPPCQKFFRLNTLQDVKEEANIGTVHLQQLIHVALSNMFCDDSLGWTPKCIANNVQVGYLLVIPIVSSTSIGACYCLSRRAGNGTFESMFLFTLPTVRTSRTCEFESAQT